jgi:hypothetical protein
MFLGMVWEGKTAIDIKADIKTRRKSIKMSKRNVVLTLS